MNNNILLEIEDLINKKKIKEAQIELSKLGQNYNNNATYLYLRGRVFYLGKLYYAAIDALLIALEFGKHDEIYDLIAELYDMLDNKELSQKIKDPNLREQAVNFLKDELSGIRLPSSYLS